MNKPVAELIQQRFSCRRHLEKVIEPETRNQLQRFLVNLHAGPFGSPVRFELIAATEQDRQSLKGVGTYGVIRNAQGFIVGAVGPGEKNMEDFGYLMEEAILFATGLGLGTCWLGGSFTKSGFAKKIGATAAEVVPAVTSIGYIADRSKAEDWIRRRAGGASRLPAERMFFEDQFGKPMAADRLGAYAAILDMVRWGPSASNKQPWRIVRTGEAWHFYLQRTPGYGKDSFLGRLIGVADVQRLDMGIAMCHFELSAKEFGLAGVWRNQEPNIKMPDTNTEYVVTWIEEMK
ncbi:MAG: nitroreductase family protein [Negativicutes bacterium]